jgi:hypothetical protein
MVTACSGASLESHKNSLPEFTLEQFFDGELKAYGLVLDRAGNLQRRFEVKLIASWSEGEGVIREWFTYDDGELATRIWRIKNTGTNEQGHKLYQGTADDVVGTAEGRAEGSALYWRYDLLIPVDGTTYQITLDDWMFLIDEKRLINKTELSKWGFHVGDVILYIEKIKA